jgi:hypothetical protein
MTQAQVSTVILLTWISNTFARSSSKRAIVIGFINTISSFAQILSPSVMSLPLQLIANDANMTTGTYGYQAGAQRIGSHSPFASR